ASRETTTNEIGVYTIPALPPGTYDVRAEIAGFAPQRRQIALVTNSTLTVNYELGVAGVQESLTVSGQAPLVEPTQAVVASSIRQQEVRELPMINRSLT